MQRPFGGRRDSACAPERWRELAGGAFIAVAASLRAFVGADGETC